MPFVGCNVSGDVCPLMVAMCRATCALCLLQCVARRVPFVCCNVPRDSPVFDVAMCCTTHLFDLQILTGRICALYIKLIPLVLIVAFYMPTLKMGNQYNVLLDVYRNRIVNS